MKTVLKTIRIFSFFILICIFIAACDEPKPRLTGKVSIDGNAYAGQTLTANTDGLGGSGAISYQWKLDGNDLNGAKQKTYVVQTTDADKSITVRVTRAGYTGAVESEPAFTILPPLTGSVSISGTANVGETLTADIEALGGSGKISFQWRLNGNNINGANGSSYIVPPSDEGSTLTVSAARADNSGEVVSKATTAIIQPVSEIINLPSYTEAGGQLQLTGKVLPENASNNVITWSLKDAGSTGAAIYGITLYTTYGGTVAITASIPNGAAHGIPYTQDFFVTIEDNLAPFNQWVRRVNFSEQRATVEFENLKGQTIYLVKVNTSDSNVTAGSTGSVLNVVPDLSAAPAPLFSAAPKIKLPRMGRPEDDVLKLHPPLKDEASLKPLFNFVPPDVGSTRTFWLETIFDSGQFTQRTAVLTATGAHSNVWVINNSITAAQAQVIAGKFDIIYPVTTNLFGYEYGGKPGHHSPGGRDGDPKIQILVYNIGNDIAGYFWAKDYYNITGSNMAEMFYLDSDVVKDMPHYAYDTLTHEFQHMINFNEKELERGQTSSTWYNEMMSMMSQDVISSLISLPYTNEYHIIQTSIPFFLSNYTSEGFTEWRGSDASYSSKYAFGAYLLRNYGGAEFVKSLASNNSVDTASISAALDTVEPGLSFSEALIRFGEAMVFSGSVAPADVKTFDKTVTKTINGTTYTVHAFNIWNMRGIGSSQNGPTVYNLNQRNMRGNSVSVHTADAWKNKAGSFSITLQRPSNSDIDFVLMAK